MLTIVERPLAPCFFPALAFGIAVLVFSNISSAIQPSDLNAREIMRSVIENVESIKSANLKFTTITKYPNEGEFGTNWELQCSGDRIAVVYEDRRIRDVCIFSPTEAHELKFTFRQFKEVNGKNSTENDAFFFVEEKTQADSMGIPGNCTHPQGLVLNFNQPVYHSSWLPELLKSADERTAFLLPKGKDVSDITVSESEHGGNSVIEIGMVAKDEDAFLTKRTWKILQSPDRILAQNASNGPTEMTFEVVKWLPQTEDFLTPFPQTIRYETRTNGEIEQATELKITSASFNLPIEESVFSLKSISALKPGQAISWISPAGFPCQPDQQLFWNGENLVCGSEGRSANFSGPSAVAGRWLRLAAIFLMVLGVAGMGWYGFRTLRRRTSGY